MGRTVTIADVAAKARVSISTVSRVLNEQHTGAPEVRERVLSVAQALGYRPSSAARVLATGKGHARSMGFVMESYVPLGTYYGDILRGAEAEARREGYDLYFSTAYHNLAVLGQGSKPRDLYGQAVRGVVFAGEAPSGFHEAMTQAGIRVVHVNSYPAGYPVDCVMCDNFAASYRAVRWLLGLGHRDVACIGLPAQPERGVPPSIEERMMGYRQALADAGIACRDDLVEWGDSLPEHGAAAMDRLARVRPRPTAVFATVDELAVGAIAQATRLGLAVPEDLSIMGVNDLEMARRTNPPLTTIRIPTEDMGRAAVQRALELMREPNQRPRRIEVLTELVTRGSCGAAPK